MKEIIGGKVYHSGVPGKDKYIYMIVKAIRNVADMIYGLYSRFPMCCIIAYMRQKNTYWLAGVQRVLCYKCYLKNKGEK